MPELPEVESVAKPLRHNTLGRRVVRVDIRRHDVITGDATPAALLQGTVITDVLRHGKQLAWIGEHGVVNIHLGMSGRLNLHPADVAQRMASHASEGWPAHTHVIWHLDDATAVSFLDPRRFGGLWTFPNLASLQRDRWDALGPDATTITPARLHATLATTNSPLKAALLDQRRVAGLGNIYVDEALFAARLHPLTPACTLTRSEVARLTRQIRRVLDKAIHWGGSTLRDYRKPDGTPGDFHKLHRVYGRAGQPCLQCGTTLTKMQVAQRTTVTCPQCQS